MCFCDDLYVPSLTSNEVVNQYFRFSGSLQYFFGFVVVLFSTLFNQQQAFPRPPSTKEVGGSCDRLESGLISLIAQFFDSAL
jgi:hypothetical protein